MQPLGNDWSINAGGIPFRYAARILLFDASGRILLLRGHDYDQPDRHWWFTIGGGLEAGESPREGALRELYEETGISLTVEALEGPVITRKAVFNFHEITARQNEVFFIARVDKDNITTAGWTKQENILLDEYRWWKPEELAATSLNEEIFPQELKFLAPQWKNVWDGIPIFIDETLR